MDLRVAVGVLAAVAAVMWIAAGLRGQIVWRNAARGLVNGLLVAAILAGLAAAGTLVIYRGDQPPLAVVVLLVPAVIGLGYLLLGLALMPVGFLFGGGSDWARFGTWTAVVVIVFSLGIGYTAYSSFQEKPATPLSSPSPAARRSAGDGDWLESIQLGARGVLVGEPQRVDLGVRRPL